MVHVLKLRMDIPIFTNCIGTEKLILWLIHYIGPYTFEGALINLQILIRTSIIYAAETKYNMSEKEWRVIESIEESALIKVVKTKRSCPRHLLYLEFAMYPARYQEHRQMLKFLQYILQQPDDSILLWMYRMYEQIKIEMIGNQCKKAHRNLQLTVKHTRNILKY